MDVQVFIHQRLEVVGRHAADDDHLDGVGEEVERLVPRQELRVLGEDGAVLRVLEVPLERHDAGLLREPEQLVEHRQQIGVVLLAEARLHRLAHLLHQLHHRRHRCADQELADGRAEDDEELVRLVQQGDLAVVHDVAAEHRADHHEDADDDHHRRTLRTGAGAEDAHGSPARRGPDADEQTRRGVRVMQLPGQSAGVPIP